MRKIHGNRSKGMVKSSLLRLSASALLVMGSLCAQDSQERWYEIEVLVFKHKRADLHEELWKDKAEIAFDEKTRDFITDVLFPEPITEEQLDSQVDIPLQATNPQAAEIEESSLSESAVEENELLTRLAEIGVVPFSPLSDELLQLKNIYTSLSRSSQYEPLSHFAWRQPVLDKYNAEWVRVVGGINYVEQFDHSGKSKREEQLLNDLGLNASTLSQPSLEFSDSTFNNELITKEENENNLNVHEQTLTKPVYIPVPELDGVLQVYLGRYLHINTNLVLRIPGEEELDISAISSSLSSSLLDLTQNDQLKSNYESSFSWSYQAEDLFTQQKETTRVERLINYPMKQSRRIRSGETHHFDHPLFGLIIQVRPFDIEAILEPETSTLTDQSSGR